jgi:hypothetical protein
MDKKLNQACACRITYDPLKIQIVLSVNTDSEFDRSQMEKRALVFVIFGSTGI